MKRRTGRLYAGGGGAADEVSRWMKESSKADQGKQKRLRIRPPAFSVEEGLGEHLSTLHLVPYNAKSCQSWNNNTGSVTCCSISLLLTRFHLVQGLPVDVKCPDMRAFR